MVIMHILLVLTSLGVVSAMMYPTLFREATTQYYLILVMIVLIALYGVFGLIVYYRFRFLLRVLSVASAAILGIIMFLFIMSYISGIACRYDEQDQRSVRVSKENCTGGVRPSKKTENETLLHCRYPVTKTLLYSVSFENCSSMDFRGGHIECLVTKKFIKVKPSVEMNITTLTVGPNGTSASSVISNVTDGDNDV